MAVSRSYPRHFFPFCEKKKKAFCLLFSSFPSFLLSFAPFFINMFSSDTGGFDGEFACGFDGGAWLGAWLGAWPEAWPGTWPSAWPRVWPGALTWGFKPGAFKPGAFKPGAFKPGALHPCLYSRGFKTGALNPSFFFPFWLTTTLSHPMAVFSANEIRTFFFWSDSTLKTYTKKGTVDNWYYELNILKTFWLCEQQKILYWHGTPPTFNLKHHIRLRTHVVIYLVHKS